jgi:DNA mismatch repair protein MutS
LNVWVACFKGIADSDHAHPRDTFLSASDNAGAPAPAVQETPLIRQYLDIKAQHPDHILFFRCGDFYEMFFEDAQIAAKILGITLTARGLDRHGQPIPLSGIPFHALDQYLARMVRAGYRVALCEQVEDPKQAKGVVRREVSRLISPGTIVEEHLLDQGSPNYVASLDHLDGILGLAAMDFSTGQFLTFEFQGKRAKELLFTELVRLSPVEILVPRHQRQEFEALQLTTPLALEEYSSQSGDGRMASCATLSVVEGGKESASETQRRLIDLLQVKDLSGVGLQDHDAACRGALRLLDYVIRSQQIQPSHIQAIRFSRNSDTMTLDAITQRSLELVANLHDGTRRHTLLDSLDRTLTPMGTRALRNHLLQPLRDIPSIEARQDAVAFFVDSSACRGEVRAILREVRDLERLLSRASLRTASPRDLQAMMVSLKALPRLRQCLDNSNSVPALLGSLRDQIADLDGLTDLLEGALVEEPPAHARDGGIVRNGFDQKLDDLRSIVSNSKDWIASLRQREAERTGINSLKIGFNRVFGYYLEVSNANKGKVPKDWLRKQTLSTGERYVTEELKAQEDIILHAEERSLELEQEWFEKLRLAVCDHGPAIQKSAEAIGLLDVLAGLAEVAHIRRYSRPHFLTPEEGEPGSPARHSLVIRDGRHPILESLKLDQPFVPNDSYLHHQDAQILLITGPNMAGKSTYIRQVALITLLAHVGSFVPATECRLTPVDRIFTRIGAMDHLAKGQSTFLVEMSETANILNNATDDSLVILDEIGRGTSTYDGLSIAWAVLEYLHQAKGRRPRTLFATHYHELTQLESRLPRVRNHHVAISEDGDSIHFLYRILRGTSDRSYGIHAAKLAGLPKKAIDRASRILADLEAGREIHGVGGMKPDSSGPLAVSTTRSVQLQLFDAATDPIHQKLAELNIHTMTPLQALSVLAELINDTKKREA